MQELKKDEELAIPGDFDYFSKELSLPNEIRSLLSDHKPASVSSILLSSAGYIFKIVFEYS